MPPLKRQRDVPAAPPLPSSSTSTAGKRVKFDPATFADEGTTPIDDTEVQDLESDLTSGTKKKAKDVVVTDGYDSDSSAGSDDGFGIGGGRKGTKGKDATAAEGDGEDEDDDMFGGEDEEDAAKGKDTDKGKGKGKGKEFLEMGDIEGQEFGKGEEEDDDDGALDGKRNVVKEAVEDEEDYLEEDDLANDDDAPRTSRNKASMGYKLSYVTPPIPSLISALTFTLYSSAFNMTEELSEGRFSTDGSYIPNSNDPMAAHDAWLSGVSKSAIRAAREAKARMEEEQKKKDEEESGKGQGQITQERDDCFIGLLNELREGETVTMALARLGDRKKKLLASLPKQPKKSSTASTTTTNVDENAMELDTDAAAPPAPVLSPATSTSPSTPLSIVSQKIDRLTHLASTLLSLHGELEIYSQTYSSIIQTLKTEGAVRRDWVPPVDKEVELELEEERREREEKRLEKEEAGSVKEGNRSRVVISRPGAGAEGEGNKYWYKWIVTPSGQEEGKEYGPYKRNEVENWVNGGYFGVAGNAIVLKLEGNGKWEAWNVVNRY